MLAYLNVENFAVVEKVEIDFSPRFNVLTGETGTGKSILIDAINIFLIRKVPENCLRDPEQKMVVEAMFVNGEDEFSLRREVFKRKTVSYLNGKMVPFDTMRQTAQKLLNIYGQNDHLFLLNVENHRNYIDEFSQNILLLKELWQTSQSLKKAKQELKELQGKNEKIHERMDFLLFQMSEIEALGMEPGDEEKLTQQLKILSSAEEIIGRSNSVVEEFYQGDQAIYSRLAENISHLEYLKKIYPEMEFYYDEVEKFYNLLPEISSTLSNNASQVEYNEQDLNEIETKLHKLNRLKSKYSLDLKGLLKKLETLRGEKDSLLNMGFSLKEKEQEIRDLLATYTELNLKLRTARKKYGAKLSSIVEKELTKLEMPKARFEVVTIEKEPDLENIGDKGTDRVEFYFSANPGQKTGPIKTIASGGELSRLMLVFKSLQQEEQDATFIFDEIDTGIGGRTAEFVGEKLRKISEKNQVICISHLPQIASFADNHFAIRKSYQENQTFSQIQELSDTEKVNEIARLMAGSQVDESVLSAARNLLQRNNK